MFGFNFFKRQQEDKASRDIPPPLPSYENAIPADSRGPLVDRVVEQLEMARNKFIRIGGKGGSAAELAAALFPGDVVLGGECTRLYLGRSGEGSRETLTFLRRGRGEDLHLETIKTKRLRVGEIDEIVSGRATGSPLRPNLDPDVMNIARTLLGDGPLGSSFRQLVVKINPQIYAEICPERGIIEQVSRDDVELKDQSNVSAVIAVSSVFDCAKDYIVAFAPSGFVSERAQRNIDTAVLIANSFENASRLRLMESISGL